MAGKINGNTPPKTTVDLSTPEAIRLYIDGVVKAKIKHYDWMQERLGEKRDDKQNTEWTQEMQKFVGDVWGDIMSRAIAVRPSGVKLPANFVLNGALGGSVEALVMIMESYIGVVEQKTGEKVDGKGLVDGCIQGFANSIVTAAINKGIMPKPSAIVQPPKPNIIV